MKETPELRWFEEFPRCRCGGIATGILRGDRNQSYGYHCNKCAKRRLRDAEKERTRLEKMKAEGLLDG